MLSWLSCGRYSRGRRSHCRRSRCRRSRCARTCRRVVFSPSCLRMCVLWLMSSLVCASGSMTRCVSRLSSFASRSSAPRPCYLRDIISCYYSWTCGRCRRPTPCVLHSVRLLTRTRSLGASLLRALSRNSLGTPSAHHGARIFDHFWVKTLAHRYSRSSADNTPSCSLAVVKVG